MSRNSKEPRCCPHCLRPFAPAVQLGGPVRQRMYDFIAANPQGVTRAQVMDHIYCDDPDGGPEWANGVSVQVCNINKHLKKLGLIPRVVSTGGPGATYSVAMDGVRRMKVRKNANRDS